MVEIQKHKLIVLCSTWRHSIGINESWEQSIPLNLFIDYMYILVYLDCTYPSRQFIVSLEFPEVIFRSEATFQTTLFFHPLVITVSTLRNMSTRNYLLLWITRFKCNKTFIVYNVKDNTRVQLCKRRRRGIMSHLQTLHLFLRWVKPEVQSLQL